MQEPSLGRFGDRRLGCVGGKLLTAMQNKRTLCEHRLGKDLRCGQPEPSVGGDGTAQDGVALGGGCQQD